jgi:pyrimidine and pyridine-specific 5'-nucleotidase
MLANVEDPSKCFFVDDSMPNVEASLGLGWGRCVHYAEPLPDNEETSIRGQLKVIHDGDNSSKHGELVKVITNLEQLRIVWSDVFKSCP